MARCGVAGVCWACTCGVAAVLQVGLLDPGGLMSLPGLRSLMLNACGLVAWPLPLAQAVLPALLELQVRACMHAG